MADKKKKKHKEKEVEKIQKLKKVEKKKIKKENWMLTQEEIDTVITDNYKSTTVLCERKLLEAGFAYLIICNEKYVEEHMDAFICFHMRMCSHIEELVKVAFDQMDRAEKTKKETEAYVQLIQGKCFQVMRPVIDIIQDMKSKSEFAQIIKFFGWMEKLESMDAFLKKPGDYQDAMDKLEKMLKNGIPDEKPIRRYEKKLTVSENLFS